MKSIPERLKANGYRIPSVFYSGSGCVECEHTGFTGRIGIYEVLVVTPHVREAILNRASSTTIKEIAIEEGMTTMFEDGLAKAESGLTTMSEVLRTISE
jgi:type II secretory ATPase GspE/PulE/Tfp pilus assembly ATPase PilB-like protein